MLSSVLLFLLGGVIAYWTLGPALDFLISWAGDDVQVGANSVVVKDVPVGAVATGIPAVLRFPKRDADNQWLDPAIFI